MKNVSPSISDDLSWERQTYDRFQVKPKIKQSFHDSF